MQPEGAPTSASGVPAGSLAARLVRAMGGSAATMLALAWSRVHVPPAIDRWLEAHPVKASPDLVWGSPPKSELEPGVTQPRAFLYILIAVVVAAAGWFLIEALLARFRASPWVARALAAALVVALFVQTFGASVFLGQVALVALVPLALVFAAYDPASADAEEAVTTLAPPSRVGGAIVLVAEGLSLGWGVWLTLYPTLGVFTVVLLIGLAAAAGFRAARDQDGPEGERALERDALAGAPMLLLPLLGLMRDPSPLWVLGAAAAGILLVALPSFVSSLTLPPGRALRVLTVVLAPTALIAILLVPMRFRELGSIDNFDHESQHLGWINSVGFGKLMMADAGYIYGPLREYLLSLFCAIRGFTLEHVREAHVWTSILGVGLMLYAGWRISRGRAWLHLWWTYLLLAQTALLFLVKYRDQVSFGWVDLARSGFACAALVGGMEAVTSDDRDPPWRARDFFRAHRTLIAWGAFCGLATLYSQDYGPCAVGSVGLAIIADSYLRGGLGSLRARTLRALRLGLAWSAGVFAVIGAFIAIYACFGKAGLMIHRVTTWTGFLLAAAWSGKYYPINADGWLAWKSLGAHDSFGYPVLNYALPPLFILIGAAIVAMAIARRAWTARTALLCALVLFGFTTIRHALMHPDMAHIRSDGTGAILLFFAIACDLATVRVPTPTSSRLVPIGAAVTVALAIGWSAVEESWMPLRQKLHQLATGEESPSHGAPYDTSTMKRAGDINVPANAKALADYIEQTTKPTDPVWVTTGFMTGGALQFLIARRNPTPFDVAHELTTRSDQAEVLHALETDPPIVIIGDYMSSLGDETRHYIDAHWRRENVPGYGPVRRYESQVPVSSNARNARDARDAP